MASAKPVLVDSHCHLDMPAFDADREAVVERAREAGVAELLVVGVADDQAGHRRALRTAESLGLPATAGCHPHEARLYGTPLEDELRGLARERRIVALGECGLDFHYDHSPREAQRAAFRRQVRLARELGLPLVVHTREADADTAAILEEERAGEVGGVLHCFTSGPELARRAVALGFFISFSGILCFPRAETIREVARGLPPDRLLVETDAPYLAPPPHRGKRNEPAYVVEVARQLAELRGESLEQVAASVRRNFASLLRREAGGTDPASGTAQAPDV